MLDGRRRERAPFEEPMPSWALTWKKSLWQMEASAFRASGQMSAGIRSCGPRVIQVAGLIFGTIIVSYSVPERPVNMRTGLEDLCSLIKVAEGQNQYELDHLATSRQGSASHIGREGPVMRSYDILDHGTRLDQYQMLWEVLYSGGIVHDTPLPYNSDTFHSRTEYIQTAENDAVSSTALAEVDAELREFFELSEKSLENSHFFVSDTEFFGSSGWFLDAIKDDMVCHLF